MSKFILGDCMDPEIGIPSYPDKYFDLAIVDPPYGIGRDGCETGKNWKRHAKKEWDSLRPDIDYFKNLTRVSKNQIIWGANYFVEYLDPSMGWVFWDKGQDLTMSDGELAYTSFDRALRRKLINRYFIDNDGHNIHPTQKPIKLYRWLLSNYAKPGDLILDTHVGSASSLIAFEQEGFEYIGYELDEDYYNAAKKRMEQVLAQTRLF